MLDGRLGLILFDTFSHYEILTCLNVFFHGCRRLVHFFYLLLWME